MEGFASAFSRLPYFSPDMMINRSETNAARRLFQCSAMGISTNDISAKFFNSDSAQDLTQEEFNWRKDMIGRVYRWCESMQGKPETHIYKNDWTPILYNYEIVSGSGKRARDWGHLIFTDATLSRFLLIMLFPNVCDCGSVAHDYKAITKYHADRFMSLLTYMHEMWTSRNKPQWVRATYTTPSHNFALPPNFLSSGEPPSSATASDPPLFHITSDNFVPTLLEGELEKIDNVGAQGRHNQRAEGDEAAKARDHVLGSKANAPKLGELWMEKNKRECANCHEIKERDLQVCSRCKLVYYCGKECQKMAWPNHKIFCKKA